MGQENLQCDQVVTLNQQIPALRHARRQLTVSPAQVQRHLLVMVDDSFLANPVQ